MARRLLRTPARRLAVCCLLVGTLAVGVRWIGSERRGDDDRTNATSDSAISGSATNERTLTEEDFRNAAAALRRGRANRGIGPSSLGGTQPVATDRLSEDEIELRLAILRTIRDTTVDYGDRRNAKFWTIRDDAFYPRPDVSATAAILDVGSERDDRGTIETDAMYCTPLVQILLMKGHIALASAERRQAWDDEWKSLVERGESIPNGIPGIGESRFWIRRYAEEEFAAEKRDEYAAADLLPGDNVFLENPCFSDELREQAKQRQSERYRGEEGSNLFFLGADASGAGLVVHPFGGLVYTFDEYRQHMIDDWASILDTAGGNARPAMFKITYKRSPIVTP